MKDHAIEIGIPKNHKLIQTEVTWQQSKGQDTDTYFHDHLDENELIIAKYVVKDSTSIYPPFKKTITYEKIG